MLLFIPLPMNTLHITNGDTTTQHLRSLNFKGEFITWREMLCEGQTLTNVGSEEFWKNRFDFLKTSYKISKKKFIDYTLKEYRNLCKNKTQEEIVLWFDHDLFCQINMIAVISWLKNHRKGYEISLVCTKNIKNSTQQQPLFQWTENQTLTEYKKRVSLKIDDIEYADYIWQLYCSNSPLRLETVYKFNPMSPFQHLASALETHLLRFPSIENGLNVVENLVLKTVHNNTFTSETALVQKLLKSQKKYGFGDMQYHEKIKRLKLLFTSFAPVSLNDIGRKVLVNNENFYRHLCTDTSYLGGTKKYSFLHHNASNKLLQITS